MLLIFCAALSISCGANGRDAETPTPAERYDRMQRGISTGWNTWDTRSVLTHVLLPYGAAIDLNLIDGGGKRAGEFRIGNRDADAPTMRPGAHTYDGAYTDVSTEWHGLKLRVQSAADSLTNVIIVTPLEGNAAGGRVVVELKALWQRSNRLGVSGNTFAIEPHNSGIKLQGRVEGRLVKTEGREIVVSADAPTIVVCGAEMAPEEARLFVQNKAESFEKANRERFGECYEVYNAMQNVLAWDNIYDPTIRKVITPVSRNWNVIWSANKDMGGFVLFCWDTYFASMMLSVGSRELAYANAVEITRSITEEGFVPNFYTESDFRTRDRSQPPVGSLAVWTIYGKYGEKWFLELLYDDLLRWNRWWDRRRNIGGLLCWGSNPYERVTWRYWECEGVDERFGASLESGLDNSPMYDNVLFDKEKHMLMLNDAGLTGMYVMDCDMLAKIADEIGRGRDARELRARGRQYRDNLARLWDEQGGFYYNRRTDTGEFNRRTSPTNFYPMLACAPTQQQAERMVAEHLMNPDEFWGEWVIPATPRNDPAFNDNNYWRGRIWAPMNFLVYMGLRNYDLPEARKALSEGSKKLLLKSWLGDGYVFENYSAVSGVGDDVNSSDKFYHWGALLALINLMEEGKI
jgi:hypothetical protein